METKKRFFNALTAKIEKHKEYDTIKIDLKVPIGESYDYFSFYQELDKMIITSIHRGKPVIEFDNLSQLVTSPTLIELHGDFDLITDPLDKETFMRLLGGLSVFAASLPYKSEKESRLTPAPSLKGSNLDRMPKMKLTNSLLRFSALGIEAYNLKGQRIRRYI